MIGKLLIVAVVIYAILLGLGEYFEIIVYVRTVFAMIIFCCILYFIGKGIWKIIKKAKEKAQEPKPLKFIGI